MKTNRLLTLSDAHEDFKPTDPPVHAAVVITGVRMSFGSMVRLALKWGTASLVAAAVLATAIGIIYLGGILILGVTVR